MNYVRYLWLHCSPWCVLADFDIICAQEILTRHYYNAVGETLTDLCNNLTFLTSTTNCHTQSTIAIA
jgi:hypothetical protein